MSFRPFTLTISLCGIIGPDANLYIPFVLMCNDSFFFSLDWSASKSESFAPIIYPFEFVKMTCPYSPANAARRSVVMLAPSTVSRDAFQRALSSDEDFLLAKRAILLTTGIRALIRAISIYRLMILSAFDTFSVAI